jgi:hypothetical protein
MLDFDTIFNKNILNAINSKDTYETTTMADIPK